MQPYTPEFFDEMSADARRAAGVVVPLVLRLLQPRRPRSVLDVGCGTGSWLAAFRGQGIEDVLGVDGEYVDRAALEVPPERFMAFDLRSPLRTGRRFDLVISLEVAEHLPEACAGTFVRSLTGAAPVVLFSAAIPHQGGTHHVNEQWQDYWADLFRRDGYQPIDCIRRHVWRDPDVAWYYAQNTLLYVGEEGLARYPILRESASGACQPPLSVAHPARYAETAGFLSALQSIAAALATIVPRGEPFILVDEEVYRPILATGARALAFPDHGGEYWGPPSDDDTAIRELERLRGAGAKLIVFAGPALWQLEHFTAFRDYLVVRFRCVLRNDRLVVFDLAPNG